jgi:hypothetical protein
MRTQRPILFVVVIGMLLIFLESASVMAQEKFSAFSGKVMGIRMRAWLDVQNQADQAVMNFRIGRKTVYIPRRYPNPGETVKVEYQIQKGVPVAFTVTIEGAKETSKEGAKGALEEEPVDSSKEGKK